MQLNNISRNELPKCKKDFLQAAPIKVKLKAYQLAVAATYCLPGHNIKK